MCALPRLIIAQCLLTALWSISTAAARDLVLSVQWPAAQSQAPASGRLLIMFAPVTVAPDDDVRRLLTPMTDAIAFFGHNISSWRPGTLQQISLFDSGFPYARLADLPRGTYRVQASFEPYLSYRRADGHELYLPAIEPLEPPDRASLTRTPHRWRSTAEIVHWDGQQVPGTLVMNNPIAHSATAADTPWIRSLRIRSERLSAFWGRDIFLGALITLPAGYAEHSKAHYPLVVRLSGLPRRPPDWREAPPDEGLSITSGEWKAQQAGWENFQYWQASNTPRMIIADLQHPTPYGESSMVINSLNSGPYADAIRYELLPAIEKEFRVLQGGWARFIFGAREGAWSALAWQIRHPQDFNGAFAACPDAIDFRHFGAVNLQQDDNALFDIGPHLQVPRPARRTKTGRATALLADVMQWEKALADQSRSQEIWDRWEAAFSPVDQDGYPQRIWHRVSGAIDGDVAEHWYQEHDLLGLVHRLPPASIEPLRGKLRIRIGDRDEYFMDNAVRSFEASIRQQYPELELSVDYGRDTSACWTGRHDLSVEAARQRHLQDILPWALERLLKHAPEGFSAQAWRY